jgi:hypothetical protein
MITDDDLRVLLTSDESPRPLSPALVRARAGRIRRVRRLSAVAVTVLVVPLLALVSVGLTGHDASSTAGGAAYPPVFDGDGHALQQQADGKVALAIPDVYASTGPSGLCWGGTSTSGIGGMCVMAPGGLHPRCSRGARPGRRLAKYPNYRILTAAWDGPDTDVMLRGWDTSGRLILDVGCPGGCPIIAQPLASGVPAPAPSSLRPLPVSTAVPDGRDFVVAGVAAWPTCAGVCVGDQSSTQCAMDGNTAIDDGFALGKGIAVTIIGKPLAMAELMVGSTSVQATVLGIASHPQWRVVAATLQIPGAAGKPVSLKGWEAAGKLVVDFDPAAASH